MPWALAVVIGYLREYIDMNNAVFILHIERLCPSLMSSCQMVVLA